MKLLFMGAFAILAVSITAVILIRELISKKKK
jgi:hypothetical protein